VVGAAVVVGSTVLTGSGGSSGSLVAVGSGWGPVATGGRDGRAEGGVAVVGAWAARAIGATLGGGPGGSGGAVVEEDPAVLALEGATAGGSVATGASVGSAGMAVAAGGSCWEGTKAAEATIAASIEKVSPNATSMRRRGRRCSARWRGARLGIRLPRVRRRCLGI
jgi:hypothetical protein